MSTVRERVVLDTNQIVGAGTRWLDDPAANQNNHRWLLAHVATTHTGLYCTAMLGEYVETLLTRGHPQERVGRLVALVEGAFEEVALTTPAAPFPPADPDDEVFVLCALDGNAGYLVSEDQALLALDDRYAFAIGRCVELMGDLGVGLIQEH